MSLLGWWEGKCGGGFILSFIGRGLVPYAGMDIDINLLIK